MIKILVALAITFIAYILSLKLNQKLKLALLNPVLVSTVLIVLFLKGFKITYESYELGGRYITYLLGPIVVLLAIPLYKSRHTLKSHMLPIIAGIAAGIVTTAASVYLLGKLFGLEDIILISLLPKSVTSPMAVEASNMLGGISGLTVVVVIITGIIGATVAPLVQKYGKIKDETAMGIGIGSSSHGVGTAKAVEMGQETGAASGLAMGLTGVSTILLVSLISRLL